MVVVGNDGRVFILVKDANYDWIKYNKRVLDIAHSANYVEQILERANDYGFSYHEIGN